MNCRTVPSRSLKKRQDGEGVVALGNLCITRRANVRARWAIVLMALFCGSCVPSDVAKQTDIRYMRDSRTKNVCFANVTFLTDSWTYVPCDQIPGELLR